MKGLDSVRLSSLSPPPLLLEESDSFPECSYSEFLSDPADEALLSLFLGTGLGSSMGPGVSPLFPEYVGAFSGNFSPARFTTMAFSQAMRASIGTFELLVGLLADFAYSLISVGTAPDISP